MPSLRHRRPSATTPAATPVPTGSSASVGRGPGPAVPGTGTGTPGGRLFTTPASRRAATANAGGGGMTAATTLSERDVCATGGTETETGTGSGTGANNFVDDCGGGGGGGGTIPAAGGGRGRPSQLPANILRRMFGKDKDKDKDKNNDRRGSNDTCPEDEEAGGDGRAGTGSRGGGRNCNATATGGAVTVRDLGYGDGADDGTAAPAAAAAFAAAPCPSPRPIPALPAVGRRSHSPPPGSAVTFREDVRSVVVVANLSGLSILQRTELYYGPDEYGDLQERIKDDIRALRRRRGAEASKKMAGGADRRHEDEEEDDEEEETDETGPCSRGIEHYLLPRPQRLARTEAASGHISELLRCQHSLRRQQQQHPHQQPQPQPPHSHQLAARSLELSAPARLLALEMGRRDEAYVRRVWDRDQQQPCLPPPAGPGRSPQHQRPAIDGSTTSRPSSSAAASLPDRNEGPTDPTAKASASPLAPSCPLPPLVEDDGNEERARCA